MKLLKPKIVTGSPDLDEFVQIPQKKKGFFAKAQFFLTKTRFLIGLTIFWVFEALGGSL